MTIIIKDVFFAFKMQDEHELNWHGRLHTHGKHDFEFHYFIQGKGTFTNDNTRYEIHPGSLMYSLPSEKHAISVADTKLSLTYYAVLFEPVKIGKKVPVELHSLLYKTLEKKRTYQLGTRQRFFFEEIKDKVESNNKLLQTSGMHQFMSFMYSLAGGEKSALSNHESNLHIERALRIMQDQVFENLTLKDITGKLELADSYFIRLFKGRMNISPMKYYTRMKIEAAASLLTHTNLPIYRISQRLHFNTEFHFSRTFKQYKNISPSVYRKLYDYKRPDNRRPGD
jgi:AraC-like DNA-binding protein